MGQELKSERNAGIRKESENKSFFFKQNCGKSTTRFEKKKLGYVISQAFFMI
jgi:hypothetical protein